MTRVIFRFLADETGASAVEYGLVVTLIAVAIVGVLSTIGTNLVAKASEVADALVGVWS